jgi:hypothetical protein
MIKNLNDMQKLNQANMDTALKMFGDWGRNWQSIAVEMQDYAKRSMEEGTQTFEKLMGCRSMEQAIEIQQSYVRRAYEDYMQQWQKLGGMYAELAKEATKPMERLLQSQR